MYALSFLETRGVLPLELQTQVERGECDHRRDRRMKNGAVVAPAAVPTSVCFTLDSRGWQSSQVFVAQKDVTMVFTTATS